MTQVNVSWFVKGLKEHTADAYIIVDVLRFSTLVVTALSRGIDDIYVFSDLDAAYKFHKSINAPLAAEVDGIKPPFADLDNSPTGIINYVELHGLGNSKLVIRTTSGALLVSEAINLGLKNVFIGSLVNAHSVAKVIYRSGISSINIVCAGYRRNQFAIEDFLGAGAIIYELSKYNELTLSDEAIASLHTFDSVYTKGKIFDVIKLGRGGSFLWNTGRENDVIFSSKVNTIDVVPYLINNVIKKYQNTNL